jgi:predicted small lipoprotein YifL
MADCECGCGEQGKSRKPPEDREAAPEARSEESKGTENEARQKGESR